MSNKQHSVFVLSSIARIKEGKARGYAVLRPTFIAPDAYVVAH